MMLAWTNLGTGSFDLHQPGPCFVTIFAIIITWNMRRHELAEIIVMLACKNTCFLGSCYGVTNMLDLQVLFV